MKRPKIEDYDTADKIGCFELIFMLEQYCDYLEKENSILIEEVMKVEEEIGCS